MQVKLNLGFLILISMSLLMVSTISFNQFSKTIINQNKNNLVEIMKQKGESIDRSLQDIDKNFEAIASNDSLGEKVAKYKYMDPQKKIQAGNEIQSSLSDLLRTRIDVADAYLLSNSKDIFYYGGYGLDAKYDIFTDSYYTEFVKSNKNLSRTIPYESKNNSTRQLSSRVITCFYKMRISTSLTSVGNLVVNLKEDYLYDLIKDMELDYNTKIVILDKNNNVVMDPSNRNNDGKGYDTDIVGKASSNSYNWFNKQIKGENNLVTFYKFSNSDWILAGITPINNMTKAAAAIRLQIFIIGIISIGLIFFLSTFITRDITKGLNELIKRMDKVKEGNLNVEALPNRKDEVGLLEDRFFDMLESFKDSIKNIKDMSGTTSNAADEISDNAIKNYEEFKNMNERITEIQSKSQYQNQDIEGINKINNELSNKIEYISNYFKNINNSIIDTNTLTGKGKQSVELLKEKSEQVASITLNILSTFEELNNEFKEIGKITGIVKVVSRQTDLLALNAEIEAARLAEQGKSFSVIAKSVKELATTTDDSTKYIDSIINKLNHKIEELNSELHKSEELIGQQVQAVAITTDSFDSIASDMGLLVEQILHVKDEIDAINSTCDKINEVMGLLNVSSQENVFISKEIAISAEGRVELNKELVELSNSLKELATKVEYKVQKFKI